MRNYRASGLAFACLLAWSIMGTACGSSLEQTYVQAGYNALGPGAIKRIAVVSWAPHNQSALAELMPAVAKDRIGLKMDYLVYETKVQERTWSTACDAPETKVEAVLFLRALPIDPQEADADDDEQDMHILASLLSCKTGALLWHGEAMDTVVMMDEDLEQLTGSYIQRLGEKVRPYAVPAFVLIRDLLDAMPNPKLTDDEVLEKIELE